MNGLDPTLKMVLICAATFVGVYAAVLTSLYFPLQHPPNLEAKPLEQSTPVNVQAGVCCWGVFAGVKKEPC